MKPTLFVADDHAALADVIRAGADAVLHVDDHCDLRGLLVDLGRGRAARTSELRAGAVDGGNFLAHAVADGHVRGVRWVHSRWGGRDRDVGTVRYVGDASALPVRLGLWRPRWLPFELTVLREEAFDGRLEQGEHLDVDWDFFASSASPRSSVASRARAFLERLSGPAPAAITVAHSPLYSHPTRALFEEFVQALAARFDAAVERLPDGPRQPVSRGARVRYRAQRRLRRLGLF